MFQSTRPCGARLSERRPRARSSHVSIHAPLRGATVHAPRQGDRIPVSIHAPLRGATIIELMLGWKLMVSIHAPLRGAITPQNRCDFVFQSTRPCGARHECLPVSTALRCFNPRAPAGRDQKLINRIKNLDKFQSTRPCGARPFLSFFAKIVYSFQSTRPCGARLCSSIKGGQIIQFQSTRPCGARPDAYKLDRQNYVVSIHAPLRGATRPIP